MDSGILTQGVAPMEFVSTLSSSWDSLEIWLHRSGPLAGIVQYAGYITAAGVALMSLIGGMLLAPPYSRGNRIRLSVACCVLAGLLVTFLYWWNSRAEAPNLFVVSLLSLGLGILSAFLYLWARAFLTLICSHNTQPVIRGLRCLPDARAVLAGRLENLPPQRRNILEPRPTTAEAYFCASGHDLSYIWSKSSIFSAHALLVILYFATVLAFVGGLGAAATELAELGPQTRTTDTAITKTFSADVLFAYDKAELAQGADAELSTIADTIRSAKARSVTITGHTDSKGPPEYNLSLSERRAAAVAQWLRTSGNLPNVEYQVAGRGEVEPIALNENADFSDNEEGRRRNRRVEIRIERP